MYSSGDSDHDGKEEIQERRDGPCNEKSINRSFLRSDLPLLIIISRLVGQPRSGRTGNSMFMVIARGRGN